MTRRLIAILALVLLPEVAAAAAAPSYLWVHPAKTDLYAMTLIFDALCSHVHSKILSESDNRLNNLPRLGSPAQIAYKTAIDLQGLDRELVQRA